MAGRGHEAQAEALEIVEGVVERVDLQLAGVARAGVDFADGEAAAEPCAGGAIDLAGKLGKRLIAGLGRGFGHRARASDF